MAQIAAPRADTTSLSFVDWSAVLAGAVLAAALSFVLLTFGTAIGLSATSPWPNSGLSAKVVASLAVFWIMALQIGSVMAGGYVAGRMRSRWHEKGHEAEFRDGLHGALVWAVGILISAFLVFATVSAIAKAGTHFAAALTGSVTSSSGGMDGIILDTMLRQTNTAQAGAATTPTATSSSPTATSSGGPSRGGVSEEARAEMSRILASSVTTGSITPENRARLAQLVSQGTGVAQQEAERRVDDAVKAARAAADKARHAAILTGFVTAAGLIISLGAGWWAAMRGGDHRDRSVPARFTFGDRRRTPVS
jgi:hypothetical protein